VGVIVCSGKKSPFLVCSNELFTAFWGMIRENDFIPWSDIPDYGGLEHNFHTFGGVAKPCKSGGEKNHH